MRFIIVLLGLSWTVSDRATAWAAVQWTTNTTAAASISLPIVKMSALVIPKATDASPPDTSTKSNVTATTVRMSTKTTREPLPTSNFNLTGTDITEYIGEFESALSGTQMAYVAKRSAASNGQTLRFTGANMEREFNVTLCARSMQQNVSVIFQVHNIVFSNDGPSDNIVVLLDGQQFGEFATGDDYQGGLAWNIFKNSGRIGPAKELTNGDHMLTIRVETDQWGVELDTLTVRANGQIEAEEFMCKAALT